MDDVAPQLVGQADAPAVEDDDGLNDGDDSELSDATEEETQPSVFVRKPGRGCEHYSRGCRLVSPCCGENYWCRFCHNAATETGNSRTGHTLDRHAVKQVRDFLIFRLGVCDAFTKSAIIKVYRFIEGEGCVDFPFGSNCNI